MSDTEKIHWTSESLKLLSQLKQAEANRREAEEALQKTKTAREASKDSGLSGYWRKIRQSPSARREKKSREAEEMERLEEDLCRWEARAEGIHGKLKEELSIALTKTPSGAKRARTKKWLNRMEKMVEDLEEGAAKTLSALGRTRNSMTHNYNREQSAYPAGVLELFKESAARTKHFEKKIAEYEILRTHEDRIHPKQGIKTFPKAWRLFESSLFQDIQNRPVAVNSHELKMAQNLIQAIQKDFLPTIREIYEKVRATEDRRWSRFLEEKLEAEKQIQS